MNLLKSKKVQSLLGWCVSLVVIFWLIVGLDWRQVWESLYSVNLAWLIPLLVVTYLSFVLRALRWRYFLVDGSSFKFNDLMEALMLGQFANFFLPLRAGEFVRPWVLCKTGTKSYASYFASIVLERFFDLSIVLILFSCMVRVISGVPQWAYLGQQALLVLALCILAFILIGSVWAKQVTGMVNFVLRPVPEPVSVPLVHLAENLLQAAGILKQRQNLLMSLLFSAVVWFITVLGFSVGLELFSISSGVWEPIAVTVIVALAVAAPAAPGFIGVFQAGCIAALALFGISAEVATAYAIVMHIIQYLFVTIYGLCILTSRGLSLSKLATSSYSS